MPVDVRTHRDFAARQAKRSADMAAAVASGDEAAQQRVESEWQSAVNQMTVDLYETQNSARDREATVARIRAENPAAPDAIFQISDLTQMEAAAKQVQEVSAQRGTWSPPPQGGTPATHTPTEEEMTPEQREQAREKRINELAPTVMKKGRLALEENEEIQRLSLRPVVERFQR